MKLNQALKKVGQAAAKKIALHAARSLGLQWDSGIGYIFQVCFNNPELIPNFGSAKDTVEEVIVKWVHKYKNAYENRISKCQSKEPNTIPDPIIDIIIQGRLPDLTSSDLVKIKYAHRISMSAENILGLLLEEYLAQQLTSRGWYCAWGQTIRSVDFCSTTGQLLQVKNRSNTENSSSNKIREGTKIDKWYRVDAISGKYKWDELNESLRVTCSEESFRKFVWDALTHNPKALAIEPDNPWLGLI